MPILRCSQCETEITPTISIREIFAQLKSIGKLTKQEEQLYLDRINERYPLYYLGSSLFRPWEANSYFCGPECSNKWYWKYVKRKNDGNK